MHQVNAPSNTKKNSITIKMYQFVNTWPALTKYFLIHYIQYIYWPFILQYISYLKIMTKLTRRVVYNIKLNCL